MKKRFAKKTPRSTTLLMLSFLQQNSVDTVISSTWEQIFFYVFKEEPVGNVDGPGRHDRRASDPRWDKLLHEYKGMRALEIARRFQQYQSSKKKAVKAT